jgi:hypothetical protein
MARMPKPLAVSTSEDVSGLRQAIVEALYPRSANMLADL